MGIPLIRVQNDGDWRIVNRVGRFSMPKEVGKTPEEVMANRHGINMVKEAQDQMVDGLAKQGYVLVSEGLRMTGQGPGTFQLLGPYDHLEFSTSTDPDGGQNMPDPRNQDAYRSWEIKQKALAAKKADDKIASLQQEYDWILRAVFKRKSAISFRSHIPYQWEFKNLAGKK